MKPIPRALLIHTVTVLSDISRDTWGKETPGKSTVLSCVRVEGSSKLKLDKQNRQVQLSAVMYYDIVNSYPCRPRHNSPVFEFSENDKIMFQGDVYNIAFIKKLYAADKLHHLEIGLTL